MLSKHVFRYLGEQLKFPLYVHVCFGIAKALQLTNNNSIRVTD